MLEVGKLPVLSEDEEQDDFEESSDEIDDNLIEKELSVIIETTSSKSLTNKNELSSNSVSDSSLEQTTERGEFGTDRALLEAKKQQ